MENFTEIKYSKIDKIFKVDNFWLRDHCHCSVCYNFATKQRKFNLLDIDENVKPKKFIYTENDDVLEVKWSDDHISKYNIDFLYETQFEQVRSKALSKNVHVPWDQVKILQVQNQLRFSLTELVSKDFDMKNVFKALIGYGILFIENVPPTSEMTEMAIRRIVPIMKTFFGQMYTVTDHEKHADMTYTKEALGLHTDNTYFCDAAGMLTLHCIKHVGTGGENFFVDGLYAAMELKRLHPKAYEILTTVKVPAEYIDDGEYHKYAAPLIRIDPETNEIVQLRLNLYDRAAFDTIPQTEMREFYDSFRKFLAIINDMKNRWTFKLHPGTLCFFDNWRLFHARHAYTGARTMAGCYIQRTDYLSKARIAGVID